MFMIINDEVGVCLQSVSRKKEEEVSGNYNSGGVKNAIKKNFQPVLHHAQI